MSERISAAEVRVWAEFLGRADSLRILADQMEADAAELQRLKPLAAEAEALRRVREHPERDKDIGLWIGDKGSGCATRDHLTITAPSLTALADKIDSIAAERVPKPEPEPPGEWCVLRMDSPLMVQAEWGFTTRWDARAAARGHPAYQRRTAARVVRHPDGSFTVSPERGE